MAAPKNRRRANPEGTMRQREDGRWEVRFTTYSATGKPMRKSYYCKSKQEAVQIMRGQIVPYSNLGPNGYPQLKVEAWLQIWLTEKKTTIKKSTYRGYVAIVKNHLVGLSRYPLYALTLSVIQEFYHFQLENDISVSLLHSVHKVLYQALRYAVNKGMLVANPAMDVELPAKPIYEAAALSMEQQKRLISASYKSQFGIGIRLALATGVRIGELVALQWSDINLEERILYIRRTQSGRIGEYGSPKTPHSHRSIPLARHITEDLFEWKQEVSPDEAHGPLLCDCTGKPISSQKMRQEYQLLLEECEMPAYTFHALRHTFATRALEAGVDFKTLSQFLGHANVAFTMDVYTHCTSIHMRREMERMNYEYQEVPEDVQLSRYERYRRQVETCPPVMTKEQFRIACHISKRKAKELLDTGVVPCIITDRKTWKYQIRKEDALYYLQHGER